MGHRLWPAERKFVTPFDALLSVVRRLGVMLQTEESCDSVGHSSRQRAPNGCDFLTAAATATAKCPMS
ncbi:hypothetical protein AWZ03_013111 [Drosophila navojoa]|uniref:Uncharacterized protein n=1 Tax=Drosophila navojoa TaxID=7232 RepID=A0A484AUX9_DRONA|nr:hypothetical protein AWZ03_013111 [Drosophila navojoa]